MFTRSLERRRQTPASAPGLLGKRKESSVRSMAGESIRDRPPTDTEQTEDTETISHKDTETQRFFCSKKSSVSQWLICLCVSRRSVSPKNKNPAGTRSLDRCGMTVRSEFPRGAGQLGRSWRVLRENLDDHAAVLRAALLRLVRRDRLLLAVADHVHLVQRDLILLVEIPLDGLRALQTDLLVDHLVADVVGVPFDLDPDVLRILFELRDHLIDLLLGLVRQRGLAELEVARVLAQNDLVHEPAVRLVEIVELLGELGVNSGCGAARLHGRFIRLLSGLPRRLRLLIDFADASLVSARALLRLFHRAPERIDLVVHLADAGTDEFLGSARRRTADGEHRDGKSYEEIPKHVHPPISLTRLNSRWGVIAQPCNRSGRVPPGPSAARGPRADATRDCRSIQTRRGIHAATRR